MGRRTTLRSAYKSQPNESHKLENSVSNVGAKCSLVSFGQAGLAAGRPRVEDLMTRCNVARVIGLPEINTYQGVQIRPWTQLWVPGSRVSQATVVQAFANDRFLDAMEGTVS